MAWPPTSRTMHVNVMVTYVYVCRMDKNVGIPHARKLSLWIFGLTILLNDFEQWIWLQGSNFVYHFGFKARIFTSIIVSKYEISPSTLTSKQDFFWNVVVSLQDFSSYFLVSKKGLQTFWFQNKTVVQTCSFQSNTFVQF